MSRASAASAGLVFDLFLGEPPEDLHPVAAFGRAMNRIEGALYGDRRTAGALHAAVGVGAAVLAGTVVRSTAVATWSAVAGRQLRAAALEVGEALERGDLSAARELLPTLVGRFKGLTSRNVESRHRVNGWLWARGFTHRALGDGEDPVEVARHLVAQPVRDGLVDRVGDYAY